MAQSSEWSDRAKKDEGPDEAARARPPLIEWLVGGASALLVAAMLGFIVYQAVTANGSTPILAVEVLGIEPTPTGFRVAFRARNEGGATAAQVTVEGTVRAGEATLETSEVTLDYVPPGSGRTGALLFENDPRAHALDLRAHGHADP